MRTNHETQPARQLTVEQLLARALGRPVTFRRLRREPSAFTTLFPAEVLSAELEGGGEVSVFVKHLGQEQSDHPEKQCRDREVRIYEELLRDADLPVPRYHGVIWNEASGRLEVYLEHINDWNLKYQGLEHWFTAARRLAQLHAHFAGQSEKLRASEFLLRFDADYFSEWAERALSVVQNLSAELGAALKRVTSNYDRVTAILTGQPLTLVHNDLSPKNVIADRSCRPARICFVDWEMAGIGCGLLDLVHLKYGLDRESDRTMCAMYCDALADTTLLPATPDGLARLFAACELHKTLYRLSFAKTWQLPIERTAQWVAEAGQFFERV